MKNKKLVQILEEKMYPTLYLSDEDLKSIDDLDVGDMIEMKLKVKMVSKSIDGDGKRVSGRFEVRKAECEMEDED